MTVRAGHLLEVALDANGKQADVVVIGDARLNQVSVYDLLVLGERVVAVDADLQRPNQFVDEARHLAQVSNRLLQLTSITWPLSSVSFLSLSFWSRVVNVLLTDLVMREPADRRLPWPTLGAPDLRSWSARSRFMSYAWLGEPKTSVKFFLFL